MVLLIGHEHAITSTAVGCRLYVRGKVLSSSSYRAREKSRSEDVPLASFCQRRVQNNRIHSRELYIYIYMSLGWYTHDIILLH